MVLKKVLAKALRIIFEHHAYTSIPTRPTTPTNSLYLSSGMTLDGLQVPAFSGIWWGAATTVHTVAF